LYKIDNVTDAIQRHFHFCEMKIHDSVTANKQFRIYQILKGIIRTRL